MFEITEYKVIFESINYTCSIIHAPFIRKYIGVLSNNELLMYLAFSEKEENQEHIFQMSFKTSPDSNKRAKQLLCSVFAQLGIPTLFNNEPIFPVELQVLQTIKQDHLFIRTYYHTYRVTVKENMYNYYITVGGKTFQKCMELFLYKAGESTLAQIYSEPECSMDSFLGGGDETVDMIKGVLQLCEILFGTRTFTFHDASEIECGTKDMTKPIGKRTTKPFSLTHLSIINKCKTWYEFHFGATLKDPKAQTKYQDGLAVLNQPIQITLDDLAKDPLTRLSDEQIHELKPYFSSTKTWIQFLRSIPKVKQCSLLSWSHSYLDKLMKFQPRNHEWIIHLQTPSILEFPFLRKKEEPGPRDICDTKRANNIMTPTLMIPGGFVRQKGGFRVRTRKQRPTQLTFRQRQYSLHI